MSPLVVDSNALIGWWYYWYPPTCHEFWDALEHFASNRVVLVSEEVYAELEKWKPLYKWVDQRRDLLLEPNSDEIDDRVREIVNKYQAKLGFTRNENSADLYVIAIASLQSGCVLTDEREARRRRDTGEIEGKYRMPDICAKEKIDRKRSYEIITMADWRFEWDGNV